MQRVWARVGAEVHSRNMVARWTRDHKGEGTGTCRTTIHVPEYHAGQKTGNGRDSSRRGGRSASLFLYMCVLVPPPALEVTGYLAKEELRAGRNGNDLRAGLT
jgi:hypothetical protein